MDALLTALKAAAEPTRLRILALLRRGELAVSELTQILGQSQPRVSRHLKLLCDAGLVDRLREGTWAFYRLHEGRLSARLVNTIMMLLENEDKTLLRDSARLDEVKQARTATAADYFRRVAATWDQIRSLYIAEEEVERAMLELAGARPIGTLLDIGTGTGRILELFAPHITRGVGIDLSHDMLSVARANLDRAGIDHCHVRQGDMYHPDFPAGSFDMAIFHQVLHFADDPGRAVIEAARLLAPGGRMIIADFAPHTLEFLRSEHAHRRLGFSDDEVAGWLRGAGLALAQTKRLKGSELTVCLWLAEEQDGRAR